MTKAPKKRGFAAMTKETRKRIASMGGKASGSNFKKNRERASSAGKKGGRKRNK